MSTSRPALTDALLKDALSRRAAGLHGSAELIDDVLTAVRSTTQGGAWGLRLMPIGRQWRLLTAAALLLLAIAAAALIAGADPFRRDPEQNLTEPAFVEPFLGLPPEGVAPGTPETWVLVLSEMGVHPWYHVYVYADGRMIWARGVGRDETTTGWVQQRLTPQGIELLRTGAVILGGQSEAPASRLPASAWADREVRGFVPARFAVCYWYDGDDDRYGDPAQLADILRRLPDEAQALLISSEKTYDTYGGGRPGDMRCHVVTTSNAVRLDRILTEVGIERGVGFNWVGYPLEGGEIGPHLLIIPLLPHGDWGWAGG